jgi:outer membrane protein OmpA-like peptidoglycan-associated protein
MNAGLSNCRIGIAVVGAGICLAAVPGCATVASGDPQAPARHHVSGRIIDRSGEFRQLGTGHGAYFARCLQPACPRPTPKTLALLASRQEPAEKPAGRALDEPTKPEVDQVETAVVHFPTGSSKLDRHAKSTLTQFSAMVRQSERIVVSGRTDNTGDEALNLRLAHARATAVVRYLRKNGAATPSQIEIDARGRCCYAAGNDFESGRQLNRRTEVSIYQISRKSQ